MIKITTPVNEIDIAKLNCGDTISLSGILIQQEMLLIKD